MQTRHFERKKKQKLKKLKKRIRLIIFLILILILIIIKNTNDIHICIVDNFFTIYKETSEISINDYIVFKNENNENKIAKVVKRKNNNSYIIQFDDVRFYENDSIPQKNIYGKEITKIYNIFSIFQYKQVKITMIIILIIILFLNCRRIKRKNERDQKRNYLTHFI